jgi:hypothetical protein
VGIVSDKGGLKSNNLYIQSFMKKTNLKGYGSNIARFVVAGGIMALVGLSACKKSTTTANTSLTQADIVELITDDIKPVTGGFDLQAQAAVTSYITNIPVFTCGQSKDTTTTYTASNNSIPIYGNTLKWTYQLVCGTGSSSYNVGLTGNTSYISSLMKSADGTVAAFTISDPGTASSNYSLTGNYSRSGEQTSQVQTEKSLSSYLQIDTINIQISKTTNEIVSGTASIVVNGYDTTDSSDFSFGGTITFLGNKTATFKFNNGTTYNISWN